MRTLLFTLLFLSAQAFADVGSGSLSDIKTAGSGGGGSGDVAGPSSSTDGAVVLFDGTTGKLIKVATGSGYAYVTSGVFSVKSGTSAQYLRADGTVSTLNTTAVAEGSNLYFTNARAIAATLTGYTSGAGTVSSSDTVLQAIQKLNGNVATKGTGDVTGSGSPSADGFGIRELPIYSDDTGKVITTQSGYGIYPADKLLELGTLWFHGVQGTLGTNTTGSHFQFQSSGTWVQQPLFPYASVQPLGVSGSSHYPWSNGSIQKLHLGYDQADALSSISAGTIKVKTGASLTLDADNVVLATGTKYSFSSGAYLSGGSSTLTLALGNGSGFYVDYDGAPQLRPFGSSYPVLKANANGNINRGIWLLTGNIGSVTHANYYSGQIGYSGGGPYTPTISAWKSTASQSLVMGYAGGDDFPTVSDGTIKVKTGTNLTLDADRVVVSNSVTPASASASCVTGTITWDASYIYTCVATNTWKRAALSTW